MNRKHLLRAGITGLWLITLFWLIRYEAHPEWFTHSLRGYDGLLGRDILVSDNWMRVLDNGNPIGYSQTSVDVNDQDRERHIVFENRTMVRIAMLDQTQRVQVAASAYLNMNYRMQAFDFTMNSRVLKVKVTGTRTDEGPFDLAIDTGGQIRHVQVDIPDDIVIHSPLTALAVRRLGVDEYVEVKTFNPMTLGKETATVRALNREEIATDTGPVMATRLDITYMGSRSLAWIDAEGTLLRQQTPMGWTLERCRPEDVFKAEDDTANTQQE